MSRSIYLKDVRDDISAFKEWLDCTLPPNDRDFIARPATDPECRANGCDSRLYLGSAVLHASQRISGMAVGEKAVSDGLGIQLVDHSLDCGNLMIAKVDRHSEQAQKLGGPDRRTGQAEVVKRELVISRWSGDHPLCTYDIGSSEIVGMMGEYAEERDGTNYSYRRAPEEVRDVQLILQAMQTEISASLAIRQSV